MGEIINGALHGWAARRGWIIRNGVAWSWLAKCCGITGCRASRDDAAMVPAKSQDTAQRILLG